MMMARTDSIMYNLKSQELNLDKYYTSKFCGRASFTLGILSGFGTSKWLWQGQKKAANNYFDTDHHFEPMRGL